MFETNQKWFSKWCLFVTRQSRLWQLKWHFPQVLHWRVNNTTKTIYIDLFEGKQIFMFSLLSIVLRLPSVSRDQFLFWLLVIVFCVLIKLFAFKLENFNCVSICESGVCHVHGMCLFGLVMEKVNIACFSAETLHWQIIEINRIASKRTKKPANNL